jgi:hypothetical protein
MGLNLDLTRMFDLTDTIECPKCFKEVLTHFDDYDVECGNPNPNPKPGVWKLSVCCSECEHEWEYEFRLSQEPL